MQWGLYIYIYDIIVKMKLKYKMLTDTHFYKNECDKDKTTRPNAILTLIKLNIYQ